MIRGDRRYRKLLFLLFLLLNPLLLGTAAPEKLRRQVLVKLTANSSLQYLRYDSADTGQHRIHGVIVDLTDPQLDVRPVVAEQKATPEALARRYGAVIAVNGGYFNISDGLSVSYVTIDGQVAADPRQNPLLVGNLGLRPFLPQVLNRSELRILVTAQKQRYFDIVPHSAPIPRGYRLLHALQAGPRLQPSLQLSAEAFIRPATERTRAEVAANALSPAARTAIGLLSSQRAVLVMVERGLNPAGPQGMSLPLLADFMKSLGCSSAMALDGGSSSSLYVYSYLFPGQPGIPPAAVKSALLVFYREQ